MSSQRRFEGTDLEALLDEVREALGDDVHIVAANRVRKGGVGGFFAREYFEVIAEETESPIELRPPVRIGRRRNVAAGPIVDTGRSVPRSVLDLVEERNEEERYYGSIDLGVAADDRGIPTIDPVDAIDPDDRYDGRADDLYDERFGDLDQVSWSHARDVAVDALPAVAESRPVYVPRDRTLDEPEVRHDIVAAPRVSTESERFAQILVRLAHTTEHRATAHPEQAHPGQAHTGQAHTGAHAPAVPFTPPTVDLTAPTVDLTTPAGFAASAPAPVAPARPAAPIQHAPVHTAPAQQPAPPGSAPARRGAEEIIERPEQMLVRLGLPARFVPRGMAGAALRNALVESLDRLPRAGELPKTKGVVVAIVGLGARPVLLGRSISEELGLDPDEVVVATQSEIDGVPAWLQITEPEAADERRRSWRRRDHLTFVAVSQPSLTTATGWASDMLDRLEPTQLWGLASAGWKPEDVDAWSRRLGGFDLVALDRLVDTVSPASMLSLGLPIGRLDGDAATPERWADELLDRITAPEPAGAST